jgi:4-amino-4-deoxy-L-arabinose transferase-like glycosyltransferase
MSPRRLTVLLLLALFGWMAASVSDQFSPTADELAHLTSGYSYWTTNDYHLQPENGNFPQRWAALPLLLSAPNYPPPANPYRHLGDMWQVSFDFFYERGNAPDALLAEGRAMIALLGVATAALVYAWSRSLFGTAGGLVSLVLAGFCPVLLAHAGLATSDMAGALGFLLALLAWWRLCHRVSPGRVLAAGGALGLLALAKFSCVLFAPVAVVLAGARLLRRAPLPVAAGPRRWRLRGVRRAPALAAGGLAAAALAVAVIWAAYGFRYTAQSPDVPPGGQFIRPWDDVLMTKPTALVVDMADRLPPPEVLLVQPGVVQAFVSWARSHHLLPEAWLYGLAFVDRSSRYRMAYFAGEYRMTGWPAFFPTAFLLKTTLPALGLLLLAALVPLWGPRGPRGRLAWRLFPLLTLLAVYWAFALVSHLNIGHRHLLPTYPLLYILLGVTGWAAARARSRGWALAVALLLAWHVAESLRARPYYLASFNELAGDPDTTHRLFIDSTLDWGQDLPGLKQWLDTHAPGEKTFLSYFGSGDPVFEGITATRVADNYFDLRPRNALPVMTGGVYCLSATMLHRSYTTVRGPWSEAYEGEFQRLTAWLHQLNLRPKGAPPTDTDGTVLPEKELQTRLFDLEEMRFARLCFFLQFRRPDAVIGHTILIYRLSDLEVGVAESAPLPLLEEAAAAQETR